MKIYITGCGKSGTTLLHRLFAAFSNVVLAPDEYTGKMFSFQDEGDTILVGKRSRYEVYSGWSGKGYFFESLLELRMHKVILINIFRDGRDVIEGEDGRISPSEWIHSIYQTIDYAKYLTMNLRYEDLVRQPDLVQKDVAAQLKLNIKHKWSDYPKFLSREDLHLEFYRGLEEYELRPISTDRIGKNHQMYKYRCSPSEKREFERMLKHCEYIK